MGRLDRQQITLVISPEVVYVRNSLDSSFAKITKTMSVWARETPYGVLVRNGQELECLYFDGMRTRVVINQYGMSQLRKILEEAPDGIVLLIAVSLEPEVATIARDIGMELWVYRFDKPLASSKNT